MIKLRVTPEEYAWLEDLALHEAIDHDTGKLVAHPFASEIIVRSNMKKRRLPGWITKPNLGRSASRPVAHETHTERPERRFGW